MLNGYSNTNVAVYYNLDDNNSKLVIDKKQLITNLPLENPQYKQGEKYEIIYTPLENVPLDSNIIELAIGFRYNNQTLSMLDTPKLTSKVSATGVKFNITETVKSIGKLQKDASIFSFMLNISGNSVFNDFVFKIEHNKIVE